MLYVSGASQASLRAVANLRRLLERYKAGLVSLTICDVAREPESAERDQISFTPTLCKRAPEPVLWLVGDLSQPQSLIELLVFHGVIPKHGYR